MHKPIVIAALLLATGAFAALPAPPPEAQAKAQEAKAKGEWSEKVAAYRLCLAQDRVVAAYRSEAKGEGKPVTGAVPTPPCSDPGPYATPEHQKPLEASEAHSPSGTAASPPSRNEHASELMGTQKRQ